MKKIHQSPEFTVIKQNQANAKFFVASGGFENSSSASGDNVPPTSASQYEGGSDIDM